MACHILAYSELTIGNILLGIKKTFEKTNVLRRPGIEPGSTAWKAAMLTIIPPTLVEKNAEI